VRGFNGMKEDTTMRNFIFGFILASLLTGSLGLAGSFYDSTGQPNAPTGSIQQFDYFRQRQFFLDQGALRKNSEEMLRQQKLNPCGR
jgi:hypothetical protein